MAEERVERRLAAILAADMVGYSRLVGIDEEGTLARLKALREEVIDPSIAQHQGRIVKTMGDGLLIEFPSVVDAVRSAVEVQRGLAEREVDVPEDRRIVFRVGVNLGDIVIDGDDILGDGVNVAARLESLADPGGVCISDVVHQNVEGKAGITFKDLGQRHLKNIAKPIRVWHWQADKSMAAAEASAQPELEQQIRFCTSGDGAQIAYATVGEGTPLVKSPNWMNHLEYDWQSPVWRHLLRKFALRHQLIRFDQRGNGLSDWDVPEFSFDSMIGDMEAVVDAVGLERFSLIGISQGCSYSIAYAVQHPEQVDRLVLYGGFALGRSRRDSDSDKDRAAFERQMILDGWGKNNPAFRQFFTSLFIPGATKEQEDWFNELQRKTTSPENAARLRDLFSNIDVTDLLAQVTTPTLVLHCRDDGIVPFNEGRRMAAMIPGARFVPLEGQNHLILEDEPAWPRFMDEVLDFLAE